MAGLLILGDKTVTVEPGGEATLSCRIKNTGGVVDQFSVQVLGAAAAFTVAEPQSVSLFPGADGEITLRFKPPATQRAGQAPLGVKLNSAIEPQATVVEEATLQIGAFVAIAARLVPRAKRGRSVGKHKLVLRNTGNAPTRVRVNASDPDDLIRFRGLGSPISLPPGTPHPVRIRYRSTASHLTGPAESHPFTLSIVPEGGEPVKVEGAFLQRAAVSGWMMAAVAGVIALLALVLVLKTLQNGGLQTHATSAAAAGAGGTPTPSASAAVAATATPGAASTSASHSSSSSASHGGPAPTAATTTKPNQTGPVPVQPASVNKSVGVLFVHTTGLFSADIETLAGSPPTTAVDLTNNAQADYQSPSYSPDGLHVAYSAFAGGNTNARSVFIANNRLQSPNARVIDCSKCTLVAWSYDGSLIAFATASGTLEVVPASGTAQAQTLLTAPSVITSIAWSRDSSRIGYTVGGQVLLVSRNGGSPTTLASGSSASGVTFSPDGHSVAYGLATSGSATQITVATIDTSFNASGQHAITAAGTNQFPAWSRDGTTIYYAGTDASNFELWSVAATGGTPTQLTKDATAPSSTNISSTQPTA